MAVINIDMIPQSVIDQFWALILIIIAAIIAYIKNRDAIDAEAETEAVKTFYDPATGNAPVPEGTPDRAWKMSDVTKRWLTFDHSQAEAESLLKQVEAAEAAGKTEYIISVPSCTYMISFGLIQGSSKMEA
jgi:hypothetical protein